MSTITLFFLALGLSMDAFAVSISNGMCYRNFGRKQAVTASFAFGLFQMLMPILGYFAGRAFSQAVQSSDHWIALILLGIIGGKMLWDGIQELKNPESCVPEKIFRMRTLFFQATATSIDALAVGISFAVMQVNIVLAAGFIGCITFLCCLVGNRLGHRFGLLLGTKAEIFGGCILIAIGLKIFLEHTLGL